MRIVKFASLFILGKVIADAATYIVSGLLNLPIFVYGHRCPVNSAPSYRIPDRVRHKL